MFNGKYVSIKRIADKIKRGRLYKDIPFESIVDYAVEAMKLIMSEKYFVTKPAFVNINSYKGSLPCGFEYMISCTRYMGKGKKNEFIPMNTGTDNHHEVYGITESNKLGKTENSLFTYSINTGKIFTNFEEGKLFLVYKAVHTDENDMILIPDNVNVMLAVEFYIKYNYLNDLGSDEAIIQRRAESDEQQYCWYIGKAQAASTNMTMDEMETFANSLSQLFEDKNQFRQRLEYLHTQEFLKVK